MESSDVVLRWSLVISKFDCEIFFAKARSKESDSQAFIRLNISFLPLDLARENLTMENFDQFHYCFREAEVLGLLTSAINPQ